MNSYYQGALVPLTTGPGFLDNNGQPIDPSAVTIRVGRRGQTAIVNLTWPTSSNITHVSTGNFLYDADSTLWVPDVYWYLWEGTTPAQAIDENNFLVMPVDV